MTFADNILDFFEGLTLDGIEMPNGVKYMNPYNSSDATKRIAVEFYRKFYNDKQKRKLILGINPGRHGAGSTAIPFTDTKRLNSECGIKVDEFKTHELSSVFVYDVIKAYGGTDKFYSDYYISSISPLGFVQTKENGKEVNYNFYDDRKFMDVLKPIIVETLHRQMSFGIKKEKVVIFGSGKNYKYFLNLNEEFGFFDKVIPLEHPRYIMQYKLKYKKKYIEKYLSVL